jgi:hypothetical protein
MMPLIGHARRCTYISAKATSNVKLRESDITGTNASIATSLRTTTAQKSYTKSTYFSRRHAPVQVNEVFRHSDFKYWLFQKELYNGIPMLLCGEWIVCTPLSVNLVNVFVNTRQTVTLGIPL